jgi:hypothetical protein
MNTLKMKIHGFDESNYSLIISYASDETQSSDPDSYESYAYQPMSMWPDITDVEEIKKRLAHTGIYMAEQQKIKEQFIADEARINALKALVGTVFEYSIADLTLTQAE